MSNIHFISPDERFEKYEIINNQPYAEHLTQFLKSKAENGYVLNLNAEWGAGKTTFFQCWYNELKENHPVVYFDAWKSDFTKDPMLALMDAFHEQLISPLNQNKELIEKFFSKGSHFVKTALPSLLVGYLKNKGGMDGEDSLLTSASDEFGIPENDLSDALKDTMKAMLNQKNRVEGIEEFKDVLVQLSEDYIEVHPNQSSPVFVLIDELDRCRPTYAIEVIECVKHFFNTKNFIFVLATDTNQLQHSIKSIYGAKFDSLTYLSRFFDNSATLPAPNRKKYIEAAVKKHLNGKDLHPQVPAFIDTVFEWHETRSLREIQKTINVIDIAMSQEKSYRIIILIVLTLLKRCYPENYKTLKNNNLNPYSSRHGTSHENKIKGKHSRFELTNHTKESAEAILHVVASGLWRNKTPTSLDTYLDQKIEGQRIDEVASALLKESLTNQDSIEANMAEHFSLIEFAGFFQG
ncbi:KAP-like P-loop domain-containing protein [Vibrio crassostreae]|uniref:KAP family P-loop NTPase fold protein n=1 Tax=Vibrio crassostreae TaxID=246167 RepID=UPI000F4AAB0F|nr:P-loop NTPase fold protein [Vibrio crassostreae]ROR57445.1 KAP-like P-loop domain-containing protein [Vibrio crassostreae]